jgi:hypothetical protein
MVPQHPALRLYREFDPIQRADGSHANGSRVAAEIPLLAQILFLAQITLIESAVHEKGVLSTKSGQMEKRRR